MVSNSRCAANVNIGDRVECSGYVGTVKYIGTVDTYPSIWIGVDWDDQFRGKHNGTLNGVKYFQSRFPKSGSFVRVEKVQLGHSIVEAIVERYGRKEDELTAQQLQEELSRFQHRINAPFLELVGFEKVSDKQSNFEVLRVVNLRLQHINSSGKPGELRCLCPKIQELDISKNLISSWLTVIEICLQLDQLEWLNLSENLFSIPENIHEFNCPSIKTLICTSMYLKWEDISKVSVAFPNIAELRVPSNCIQNLNTSSNLLQNLKILDIEDNPLKSWLEVCKLSILENLEELFIGNIGLKRIEFDGAQSKVDLFRKLKKLSISHNLIDNWNSINELNRLKNLEDLRCVDNPILETLSVQNRFPIVVARIGNLKVFNGTEIDPDCRRGAEYDYMKMYGLEWLCVRDTPQRDEFLNLHNRYLELVKMYGAPEEAELIIQPKSIKNTLVRLDLVHEDKIISRKLPHTMVVQKLMLLVQKVFKLSSRPHLIYVSGENPNFKICLEDQRDIGFYSMEDGDKIVINS